MVIPDPPQTAAAWRRFLEALDEPPRRLRAPFRLPNPEDAALIDAGLFGVPIGNQPAEYPGGLAFWWYYLDAASAIAAGAPVLAVAISAPGVGHLARPHGGVLEGPFYAADRLVTAAEWAAAISTPA